MKAGRDYAWYVAYSYSYEWRDPEDGKWTVESTFDSGRFCCRKKEILAEVTKRIEEELSDLQYRNLAIVINEQYPTTPEEL